MKLVIEGTPEECAEFLRACGKVPDIITEATASSQPADGPCPHGCMPGTLCLGCLAPYGSVSAHVPARSSTCPHGKPHPDKCGVCWGLECVHGKSTRGGEGCADCVVGAPPRGDVYAAPRCHHGKLGSEYCLDCDATPLPCPHGRETWRMCPHCLGAPTTSVKPIVTLDYAPSPPSAATTFTGTTTCPVCGQARLPYDFINGQCGVCLERARARDAAGQADR